MLSRSMLGARADIPARLMSVTYGRSVIIRLNDAKTRPIAASEFLKISLYLVKPNPAHRVGSPLRCRGSQVPVRRTY